MPAIASRSLLLLAQAALLSGCAWFQPDPHEAAGGFSRREYHQLAVKAEAGDTKAARQLAQDCYLYDENNERTLYWLELAARHGDKKTKRLADQLLKWRSQN